MSNMYFFSVFYTHFPDMWRLMISWGTGRTMVWSGLVNVISIITKTDDEWKWCVKSQQEWKVIAYSPLYILLTLQKQTNKQTNKTNDDWGYISFVLYVMFLCVDWWHMVSVRIFSVMYGNTLFYACKSHLIRHQTTWRVVTDGLLIFFQGFVWVCMD